MRQTSITSGIDTPHQESKAFKVTNEAPILLKHRSFPKFISNPRMKGKTKG